MININGVLFDGRYKLLRTLSTEGGTADVWLAIDVNTRDNPELMGGEIGDSDSEESGMLVAIKIYRPKNALDIEGEQRFRDEYKIVHNCRHTNLLQPTNFSICGETPYLELPYCRNGSSELLIGKGLGENEIWKFIFDVSSGLAYLHACNPPIIHQDIKPANVLIDDYRNYAITDFGISSQRGGVHGYYYDEENSGTLAYMAPERFLEETGPMPQSDIWGFGATLCEILTGKVPFGEEGGKVQMRTDISMPALPGVSADLQRLIYACLSKEPGNRPSAEQLVEAARAKQFPVRSKKNLFVGWAVLAILLISGLSYYFAKRSQGNTSHPMIEEVYAIALDCLNSSDQDSLQEGIRKMDSLSNLNYIPAMYQMAFTYGWYSDSVSVRRKRMLGIKMEASYIPKENSYTNKAVALFERILELNDSSYAEINAQAAYRLACYYVMADDIYKVNEGKGKEYLLTSRDWAEMSDNEELIEKIDKALSTFK